MKANKKIKVIVALVLLGAICFIIFNDQADNMTNITIENSSNECIKNLMVSSIDGEEYEIESIEAHATVAFKYNLGNFNENALNMRHVINADRTENYNIVGYISQTYPELFT